MPLSRVGKKSLLRRIPVVLLCILLAGTFLRFYNLSHILLYDDEPLHQVRISYQPLPFAFSHNNGSGLFTLLVHIFLHLGDIVLMARLPSALFGTATIVVVYLLGKAFFSKKDGLIAAGLVALSPFLIRYSQYSRAYSLFVLLSLLSLYFFDKAQKENRTQSWALYGIFTTLNIYTHLIALLLLPAYVLAMAFTKRTAGKKKNQAGNSPSLRLKKFILWTCLICVLTACFYLPSVSIKEFFVGSAQRAITRPPDTHVSLLLIHDILMSQWAPPSSFFFLLFLACLAIGFGVSVRKQPRAALLSSFYVIIPLLIFVFIKPREVNVLSADRYFIFILPVLFLFIARGMNEVSTFITSLLSRFQSNKLAARGIRRLLQASFFLLVLAGLCSNFKDYYLMYWRLGSLRLENDVADLLRREVKSDALIYFDAWPGSSLITLINPLTHNLKPEEFEFMIRDGFVAAAPENRFIVYRIGNMLFQEYVASRPIDLWVATKLDPENTARLCTVVKNEFGVKVYALKDNIILHIQNADEPVAHKMAAMARIFLSLPLDKMREQQYRLVAVKAALLTYGPEEAYQNIQAYRSITIPPAEWNRIPSSLVVRLFDRIFGLSPQALHRLTQRFVLDEIQRLFFLTGNNFVKRNDDKNAYRAYQECLDLGQGFNLKVSEKLAVLAKKLTGQGRGPEALALFEKAVDLNPGKEDLRFCLAEAYRQEGAAGRAEQEYKKVFGLACLPPHFLEQLSSHPQSIIVWESAGLWHLMFRAEEDASVSGTMAVPKISEVKKTGFDIHDSLRLSANGLQFAVFAKKGAVKILSFMAAKNSRPKFDIKINGRRETGNLIVIN